MRRLVRLAGESGTTRLQARVSGGNLRLTRLLRRAGLRPGARMDGGALHVRAEIPVVAEPDPVPSG